nr:chaplin [Streptomyces sp. NBC_00995]
MIAGGVIAAGAGAASATGHNGAAAHGVAGHSPGVAGGILVQVPVHVPANVVGDTVDLIGLLDPAFGDFGPNG